MFSSISMSSVNILNVLSFVSVLSLNYVIDSLNGLALRCIFLDERLFLPNPRLKRPPLRKILLQCMSFAIASDWVCTLSLCLKPEPCTTNSKLWRPPSEYCNVPQLCLQDADLSNTVFPGTNTNGRAQEP